MHTAIDDRRTKSMRKDIKKTVKIPQDCEVKISDKLVSIKKGDDEVHVPYKIKGFKPKIEQDSLVLEKKAGNKPDKKLIHSLSSHLTNAFKGIEKKYEYKLQICSIHFPINAKIEKNQLVIKNFFGERKDRILNIKPNIDMRIEGDIITVKSSDKGLAGEQASEIEALTRIKSRDRRVFQDGIWIIQKQKGRKNGED